MYTKKMDIDYFQELAKRKRNMKHTWRIGRDDNSRNVARAAIAYRELAKPLPWEGNMKVFLQNMPTQFSDPGLKYSAQRQAFQVQLQDLEDEMDKLRTQTYEGAGNDMQRLTAASQFVEGQRDEADTKHSLYYNFKKNQLVRAIKKIAADKGVQRPTNKEMDAATFLKGDAVEFLVNNLQADFYDASSSIGASP